MSNQNIVGLPYVQIFQDMSAWVLQSLSGKFFEIGTKVWDFADRTAFPGLS